MGSDKSTKNSDYGLNAKQMEALQLLVYEGLKQQATADAVGVALSTINEWVNRNEKFQKAYKAELNKKLSIERGRFKAKVNVAVETIVELARKSPNDMVRLNAAKEIIAQAEKGATLEERAQIARIKKIEAETAVIKQGLEPPGEISGLARYENRRAERNNGK